MLVREQPVVLQRHGFGLLPEAEAPWRSFLKDRQRYFHEFHVDAHQRHDNELRPTAYLSQMEELPLAVFRAVMETNYFGAIRCIQAVARQMRERKSGCVINVSSVAGRLSSPPLSSYCASKWALEAMTEALAGEMKNIPPASVGQGGFGEQDIILVRAKLCARLPQRSSVIHCQGQRVEHF